MTQGELHATIGRLNGDPEIHGILVQLPMPRTSRSSRCTRPSSGRRTSTASPVERGMMVAASPFLPATPSGSSRCSSARGSIAERRGYVVGRGQLVGMPLAIMLAQKASARTPR